MKAIWDRFTTVFVTAVAIVFSVGFYAASNLEYVYPLGLIVDWSQNFERIDTTITVDFVFSDGVEGEAPVYLSSYSSVCREYFDEFVSTLVRPCVQGKMSSVSSGRFLSLAESADSVLYSTDSTYYDSVKSQINRVRSKMEMLLCQLSIDADIRGQSPEELCLFVHSYEIKAKQSKNITVSWRLRDDVVFSATMKKWNIEAAGDSRIAECYANAIKGTAANYDFSESDGDAVVRFKDAVERECLTSCGVSTNLILLSFPDNVLPGGKAIKFFKLDYDWLDQIHKDVSQF